MELVAWLERDLAYIRHAILQIEAGTVERFADRLLRARHVFLAGSGRSGLVLQMFAMRLMQLGLSAHVAGEPTTPAIKADDLLVVASCSGETESAILAAQQARKAGASIHAITALADSPLAAVADDCLLIPKITTKLDREGLPGLPLGTAFEQCLLLVVDGVIPVMVRRMGLKDEDLRERHANLD